MATTGGITTDDEFDGGNYTANGVALASEAAASDAANNRTEFDAADITYASVSVGTRNILGLVLYDFVSTFSAGTGVPIAHIDSGFSTSTGIPANGGDIIVAWNAQGIIQFTSPTAP